MFLKRGGCQLKEVANWESVPGYPSSMRFDWNFGFLFDAGYPIVLGETSWNSDQGKKFFEEALMPYMKAKKIGYSNIFVWAIGNLGDTQSLIDPNGIGINCDMSQPFQHILVFQTINVSRFILLSLSPSLRFRDRTILF